MNSDARHPNWLRRAFAAIAAVVASGLLVACINPADPLGKQEKLEDTQRRYTDYIRWGEVERAAMFVDPEVLEEFLTLAGTMANLRITDYDTGEIAYEGDEAVVSVTYRGYSVSEFVERTARETQNWYREGGQLTGTWRVRPQLAQVVGTLRGQPVAASER